MESGAGAVRAGLLQPQTGRPVTTQCTAQGLTTTTATGTDISNTASGITTQTHRNTVSITAPNNPFTHPQLVYFSLFVFAVVFYSHAVRIFVH